MMEIEARICQLDFARYPANCKLAESSWPLKFGLIFLQACRIELVAEMWAYLPLPKLVLPPA